MTDRLGLKYLFRKFPPLARLEVARNNAVREAIDYRHRLESAYSERHIALHQAQNALSEAQGALREANARIGEQAAAIASMSGLLAEAEARATAERLKPDSGHPGLYRAVENWVNLLLQQFEATKGEIVASRDVIQSHILASRAMQEAGFSQLNAGTAAGGSTARYLDLLEASLTGVLFEDGAVSPWSSETFDAGTRALGRDWPERGLTMIGTARMRNLRMLLERALAEQVPGDFIEAGVWRGGACIYARGIIAAHGDVARRVFVADSFRGLPPPDETAFPADAGDTHSTFQQLAVSQAQVAENFRRYGLLDNRVIFLEGWFKDTLHVAPIDKLAVLRLDGDMYESTIETLDALYHKVSPGGFVIVDDFVLEPCARAVNDYRERHGIAAPMHDVDGAAVWWQVPAS